MCRLKDIFKIDNFSPDSTNKVISEEMKRIAHWLRLQPGNQQKQKQLEALQDEQKGNKVSKQIKRW